nr:MAG TPA: hypothetical protein [Caudoviricetes sp.]
MAAVYSFLAALFVMVGGCLYITGALDGILQKTKRKHYLNHHYLPSDSFGR